MWTRKGEKLSTGKPDLLTGSRECHSLNISPTKGVNNPCSLRKDYVKNGKYTTLDVMGLGIQVFILPTTLPRNLPVFCNPGGGGGEWRWREERVFPILSSQEIS